jgi:hypothetical protein
MAVYEHTYKLYTGKLTPEWSRFLIIPRHAFRDVFASKIFLGFFVLCFVCPLVMAILIYFTTNERAVDNGAECQGSGQHQRRVFPDIPRGQSSPFLLTVPSGRRWFRGYVEQCVGSICAGVSRAGTT